MNREQKLALVIGFALVLVVGVLLTDHYSNVQQSELDSGPMLRAAEPLEPVAHARNGPPLPQGWALNVTMPEAQRKAAANAATERQTEMVASVPAQRDPVEIRIGRTPDSDSHADTLATNSDTPSKASRDLFESIRKLGGSVIDVLPELPVAGRVDAATSRTSQPNPVTARKPEQVRTPTTRAYIVQPNDSLFKIAKQNYGEGMLWQQLARANKGKIGAKGSIRPGVRLVLPAKLGSLKLRAAEKPDRAASDSAPKAAPKTTEPKSTAQPRTYTVAKGDTLGTISQRLLGSSKRMDEILKANRGLLDNANEIRVGMKLKIPGAPGARTPTIPARTYTVAKGDTLGAISQKLLGSSKRMGEILKSNRSLLDNANEIRVGMKLRIPKR